jgi:hypothetical protein
MRLVIAVGTLVAFLESEVSFQSCPPFCAELVELMSIGMRSIDAARHCGSNPGIFVAIRDLPPDLSPLSCRVHPVNLDMGKINQCGWFLRFERWYFYWNWTMGCRYMVLTLLLHGGVPSLGQFEVTYVTVIPRGRGQEFKVTFKDIVFTIIYCVDVNMIH